MYSRAVSASLIGLSLALGIASGQKDPPAPPVAAYRDEQAGGKYGFINREGVLVLKPKYERALDFVNGLARVQLGGKLGFIDRTGNVKFTLPPGTENTEELSEGLVWFRLKKRWGLCNDQGTVILEPKYDRVEPFAEGLAAVNVGWNVLLPIVQEQGKWGYVNKKGELVIPIQYEYANSFSEGLANVADAGGSKFIDRSGKVVIDLEHCPNGDFHGGLAPVYVEHPLQRKDWRTGFIDRRGKTVFTVAGYAEGFHEGLAVISLRSDPGSDDALLGYLDKKGNLAIKPRFAGAKAFTEGLAAVRIGKALVATVADIETHTWGFIDTTGAMRIEARFNEAHSFRDGIAKVHVGGKRAKVYDAPGYWRGGEWWLIDAKGKKLVAYNDRRPY